MLQNDVSFNYKNDVNLNRKRDIPVYENNKIESCPNCGNTIPIFQHVQNGMIVCFICRKASLSEKNQISAY